MMIERHEQTNAAHRAQFGWTFWVWWIPISLIVGLTSTSLAMLTLFSWLGEPYYFEVLDLAAGFLATLVLRVCLALFLPQIIWKKTRPLLLVWAITSVCASVPWVMAVVNQGWIPESPLPNRVGGWIAGWLMGSLILGIAWYWRRRTTTSRK